MNYNKKCECGKHVRRLVHRNKKSKMVKIPSKTCGNTMFKTKYRIVIDNYSGYEVQFKPWFFPCWLQCFRTNTSRTIEEAEFIAEMHRKRGVVKKLY